MASLFATALGAFLAAIVLTWLVRRIALALGVMDRPDGVRKLHRQAIPLLGGVGVFGAWLIGMTICLSLEPGLEIEHRAPRIEDRGTKIVEEQKAAEETESTSLFPLLPSVY